MAPKTTDEEARPPEEQSGRDKEQEYHPWCRTSFFLSSSVVLGAIRGRHLNTSLKRKQKICHFLS